MKSNKLTILTALAIAMLLGVSGKAGAQVITLTGGDASGGWVAPSNSVLAYTMNDGGLVQHQSGNAADAPDSTTQIIQGVTFTSWNVATANGGSTTAPTVVPGVTTTGTLNSASFYPSTPAGFGVSANDQAMSAMLETIAYDYSDPALGFSISGLAAGNYELDEFVMSGDSTRTSQAYSIDGVTTNTITESKGVGYVIENTVTVDGSGNLTFSVAGPGTPILSGFDLSSESVPEPSTLALIGLGALGLAFLIRRHRTA